jgi:hypothetical protein
MQESLYETASPAEQWNRDAARRALDELFSSARHYRTGASYQELLKFATRFRFYSPYNAMLVHVQMPGAAYVATASRWMAVYRRTIKPGARPLVILQPRGPVMFVFDVSDTVALPDAPELPTHIANPFQVHGARIASELERTTENAKRDGVGIFLRKAGSQSAGQIKPAPSGQFLDFQTRVSPKPQWARVPLAYEVLLNEDHSTEARYATLVHELAHLYCGHLGTPNPKCKWWPDRRRLGDREEEFEAESVAFLVCARLGLNCASDAYLSGYLKENADTPSISLECVMKTAGLIEQMGRERLRLRKE